MEVFNTRQYILTFCAILLHYVTSTNALICDFGSAYGNVSNNALVMCHMDLDKHKTATVVCPRLVNGVEYVVHPQPTSEDNAHVNTYVGGEGTFTSMPFSDVVRSESGHNFVWLESTRSLTIMRFNKPNDELVAITEHSSTFICGPRDLVLSDELQRHLESLNGARSLKLPWASSTPLTQEIAKIGKGLGIFVLYRGRGHLPLQGCGSRPSRLFAPDNEVTVDSETGMRSCVAEAMSKSPIGFVCEGRIEPEDCMKSLIDDKGKVVTAPRPRPYWDFGYYRPWVVAKYFSDVALTPFRGECRCVDPETGDIKAKIQIRQNSEHVCDISRMIVRNRSQPIRGPWCSVVLHPGSTLTIRFPTVDGAADYDNSMLRTSSRQTSINEYETEFLPKDLKTVRQINTYRGVNVYDEVSYQEVLVGDAIELDVSQMHRGEVTLKYHVDKPLTLRSGFNSFLYHWTLKSKNENLAKKIQATVNVSFALTHEHEIFGCDSRQTKLFNEDISRQHCSTKRMGNGIGDTYECLLHNKAHIHQAGIYCRPEERLLPGNCQYTGYDLHSNRIMSFPETVRSITPQPITGFQVLNMDIQNIPVSYACVCVNEHGYETSRLTVESSCEESRTFTVRRINGLQKILPYVSLRLNIGLILEGHRSGMFITLQHVSKKTIKLHVGTKLLLRCALDTALQNVSNDTISPTAWLPKLHGKYHYNAIVTFRGLELITRSHNDVIAGSHGGFSVLFNDDHSSAHQALILELRRNAILISKDPVHKKNVPMRFVCGKAPQLSDSSAVSDYALHSDASVQSTSNITDVAGKYTWNIVKVNVETTDPYIQGCGVTYELDELFKPETPKLYDSYRQRKSGCKIDIQAAGEAAFYCPAPYVLDPPNCFYQVSVNGEVKNLSNISKSLVPSRTNHFVTLKFDSARIGPGETLRQSPPLECRCVTTKGIVLSTIQIENYYAK
ncbi:hypothetical protein BBBOND_0101590 [Babesia bigemina]|uniref:6-Cys domain-containing protein n=1 Tax=Babesia bigemina TaxID=5866 RepID=A0A061D800_BABBI|nr:hypothetical protein BBBOND_0101590 [Babesia bigemina]CDR93830.1 hypothetical protein BBBOND_0101590 [Babesia bigemina]|eukprot:XP_012766016.1 hypothetical protein BBBOND_0101590 [Babesia bigemina]